MSGLLMAWGHCPKIVSNLVWQKLLTCSLTTSAVSLSPSKDYTHREGKMLRKLMSGSKKKWYDSDSRVERPQIGNTDFLKPTKAKNHHRVNVLNAVLIRNVTDLIGSGDVIPDIADRGVEITRVKINSDYTCLNVYWLTSRPEESFEITRLLNQHAGKLRSMLCNLNVIGRVPYIFFVKDEYQKHVSDVEAILAQADFGEDFQPADKTHHIKMNAILKQSLPDIPELKELEIKHQIDLPNLDQPPILTADETTTSQDMRMDILGVNRTLILAQVSKKYDQSLAKHRIPRAEDGDKDDVIVSQQPTELAETKDWLSPDKRPTGPGSASTILSTADIARFLQQRRKTKYMDKKRRAKLLNAQLPTSESLAEPETIEYTDCDDFFSDDELDAYEEIDGNYDEPDLHLR